MTEEGCSSGWEELLPVTQEVELIDTIISAYHTTRLSEVGAARHILSKPKVQKLLAAHRLATRPSPDHAGLVERLEAAIQKSKDQNGDMLYRGPPDQLLVDCLAALSAPSQDCEAVIRECAAVAADVELSGNSGYDEGYNAAALQIEKAILALIEQAGVTNDGSE